MKYLIALMLAWMLGATVAVAQTTYYPTPQQPTQYQPVRPDTRYTPQYPQANQNYRPAGRTCGGIAGLPCKRGDYCAYQPGVCVRIRDASGTCQPRPRFCSRIFALVCGCDGRTYSNSCEAASRGASVAYRGQCH